MHWVIPELLLVSPTTELVKQLVIAPPNKVKKVTLMEGTIIWKKQLNFFLSKQ